MKFYSKGIIEKNKIMNLSLSSSSRSLEEKAEFFPSFHQTLTQGYRLLVEYGGCDNFHENGLGHVPGRLVLYDIPLQTSV